MGFYKNDRGLLVWSEDRVINDKFELWIDQKDSYQYPVEGWHWFDSEIEARNALQCYGQKPFSSWVINKTTATWQPPTPMPTEGRWYWDEGSLSWLEQSL